jgi:DNA-binding response OmpR family regulator
MLTARSSRDDRLAGSHAGADAYVTKPFSPGRLIAAVQHLLGSPNP